ncbi:MAG TPA: hypothetical protein VFJ85_15210 [Acidimicrobiales bacterium]|nr:hypothetical protein [Acidimicrobiales bacterium]
MQEATSEDAVVHFSKYESIGMDFALVGDADNRRSFGSQQTAGFTSRSFGVGCVALLRVAQGEGGVDLIVDDGGSPYANVWRSPTWDAAVRSAAVFARDEDLVTSDVLTIAMRASGHHEGTVTVEVVDDSLVKLEVGVPAFGLGGHPTDRASGPFRLELEVPPGFDTGDDWEVDDREDLMLPVTPVSLRTRLHAVVSRDDIERIFRYIGPEGCLSPGVPVGPTRRLISDSEPFSETGNRPVLDIVHVDSRSQITVGGASPWRHEAWPIGEGTCAAAAVARVAGAEQYIYAPSGFGDLVIEWDGSTDRGSPMTTTAAAVKVFEGQLIDVAGTRRAVNRTHLKELLP